MAKDVLCAALEGWLEKGVAFFSPLLHVAERSFRTAHETPGITIDTSSEVKSNAARLTSHEGNFHMFFRFFNSPI